MKDGSPSDESARVWWLPPFVGRPNTGLQATGLGSGGLSVPLLYRPAPDAGRWAAKRSFATIFDNSDWSPS